MSKLVLVLQNLNFLKCFARFRKSCQTLQKQGSKKKTKVKVVDDAQSIGKQRNAAV